MTPAEAFDLVKNGKAVLIDVREEDELRASGFAAGALWMPTSEISEDTPKWQEFKNKLPKDKSLILYCHSGSRSGRLAEFLAQDGFTTVNLGGFGDWKNAQLPVQKF